MPLKPVINEPVVLHDIDPCAISPKMRSLPPAISNEQPSALAGVLEEAPLAGLTIEKLSSKNFHFALLFASVAPWLTAGAGRCPRATTS